MAKVKLNRDLLFYGGVTKEEYSLIEEQRVNANFRVWKIVAVISSIYFVILYLLTYLNGPISSMNRKINCMMAIITCLSFVVLQFRNKMNKTSVSAVVYILIVSLLGFSIYIGAVSGSDVLAVTFPALLLAIPLFTVDRPYRICMITLCATAVFMVSCLLFENGRTRSMDMYNAFVFCLLSQVITLFSAKRQMDAALLLHKVEGFSFADELTGFFNRRSFEEDCAKYAENPLPADLIIVSMDVNGLKNINDKKGHEAGDELICGAAECMKNCFGGYGKLYRTGGDEFMGLLRIDLERFELLLKNFESSTSRFEGTFVKGVSVSHGHAAVSEFSGMSIEDLGKISDKRMYDAKALYYSRKGVDRRGQQDAFNALCASYVKILKVNLTEDSYQVVSVRPDMEVLERNYNKDSVSQYLRDVALAGTIHPDDLDEFISKTTIKYMRDYFAEHQDTLNIFYKRKIGDQYTQSIMQIIPANDYSAEAQYTFLYVKDIGQRK